MTDKELKLLCYDAYLAGIDEAENGSPTMATFDEWWQKERPAPALPLNSDIRKWAIEYGGSDEVKLAFWEGAKRMKEHAPDLREAVDWNCIGFNGSAVMDYLEHCRRPVVSKLLELIPELNAAINK